MVDSTLHVRSHRHIVADLERWRPHMKHWSKAGLLPMAVGTDLHHRLELVPQPSDLETKT